jgi:hypothetical protein
MRLCLRSGGHDPARDGDRPMVDGNRLGMPIDPREIGGHRVVLLLIQVDSAGDALDDDQHAMRTGEARWDGRTLWLDCGEAEPPFAVDPDWLERIRPVPPGELADDTGAAFYLMVRVGPLPEGGEESGEYRPLGWKWSTAARSAMAAETFSRAGGCRSGPLAPVPRPLRGGAIQVFQPLGAAHLELACGLLGTERQGPDEFLAAGDGPDRRKGGDSGERTQRLRRIAHALPFNEASGLRH